MLRQFVRDHRGNFTILGAVLMTSLVGMGGLVTDFGNGLFNRMEDQRLADSAAVAGGAAYAATLQSSDVSTAVSRIVSLNGSSATVSSQLVSSPTNDGNKAVEVTAQTSVPMTLSRLIWNQSTLPVSVTSYAEVKTLGPGGGSGCILALDPTANQAITISGSADVQSPNCDVISNSSSNSAIDMSGGAHLTTPCTVSVGKQVVTSGLTLTSCSKPYTGAPSGSDPYASVATPQPPSTSCSTVPNPPTNIPPGYYCNGLTISSATATFQGGFYYVKGNFAIQGSSNVSMVSGSSGVTFFVDKTGTTAISGSSVVNLSAPTSGTFSGILIFGDRTAGTSNNNNISGNTSSVLQGALYFPTQEVTYSGGSQGNTTCTQVIADKITFSGATYMGTSCSGAGISTIEVPGQTFNVSLVQ